jgi:18S rRNA (adenine1779-N6/adenine1780-N6)-dimethyltransferase
MWLTRIAISVMYRELIRRFHLLLSSTIPFAMHQVGRNNFRPAPKVDSRVVRIELKNPPPPVNFTEWDGLVRLVFNRKNKTLRSVLCTKATMKLLESNLKTYRAMNHATTSAAGRSSSSSSSSSAAMDIDNNDDALPVTAAQVQALVEEVLSRDEFRDKRASKMDQDDFLALLAAFNDKGIHFS